MLGVRLTPGSLTSAESEKVPAMQIAAFLKVRTPLMAVEGLLDSAPWGGLDVKDESD